MIGKWSFLLVAAYLVAQANAAEEVNINQLLAEEAMKYPEAMEEPDQSVFDILLEKLGSRMAHEININKMLAKEAMKYPEAMQTPDELSSRTTAEINLNQLLAEEAMKHPGALHKPIRSHVSSRAGPCSIGMNNGDLAAKQPLILVAGTTTVAQPEKDGFLKLDDGKSVDMYCTGAFAAPLSGKKITAKCSGGAVFDANGVQINIQNIQCTAAVGHTIRGTSKSCYGGGTILEIGIAVDAGFVTLIEVCHNLDKQVSYYSHYSLYPSSVAFQKSVSRPSFVTGGYYGGADVNKQYTQVSQMETIEKILGAGSQKYFDLNKNVYLARGHLAAKADFVYAPPQLSTFYFINCAPQWQTFNGGNWERIEDSVKKFAADRNLNLDVYTGTWGVSTLPDDRGVQKELYLAFNSKGEGLIPVPKVYYRVIVDKASKRGLVLLGVNNPHISPEEIQRDYVICKDISAQLNWVSWDRTNNNRGYSYACEYNDFASKVGQLSLSVSGLLV